MWQRVHQFPPFNWITRQMRNLALSMVARYLCCLIIVEQSAYRICSFFIYANMIILLPSYLQWMHRWTDWWIGTTYLDQSTFLFPLFIPYFFCWRRPPFLLDLSLIRRRTNPICFHFVHACWNVILDWRMIICHLDGSLECRGLTCPLSRQERWVVGRTLSEHKYSK